MQDVEARDAIQFLFQIVQADDGAGLFRVLRADAAEIDDVGHARFATAAAKESDTTLLIGAQILSEISSGSTR